MSYAYAGENVVVVTGLPGRGKTLFSLWLVDQIVTKSKRPVYVSGVRGLKPRDGWEVLEDRSKWHECPTGSVVLIDEGQECFRPAGTGSAVPEHIAKMERVRHTGITLIITTQHPMLLHSNVRKLAQVHLHLVRKFGAENATIYRWDMVADVGTRSALLSSVKSAAGQSVWPYPKEVYGWYESAEMHTVQKKLPWQKVVLYVIPFIVIMLLFFGYNALRDLQNAPTAIAEGAKASSGETVTAGPVKAGSPGAGKTTAQWLGDRVARVEGLPHTARAYDEVTKPVRAPYPAACVAMTAQCRCYSEQGTRLDTPDRLCRQIVERGFYVEWDTAQASVGGAQERPDERRASAGRPDAPAPPPQPRPDGGPAIAMIGNGGGYAGIPPLGVGEK